MPIETRTSAAQELGTRSSTTRGRRGRGTARAYTPYIANGVRKVTTGFLFYGTGWADWGFSRENAVLTLAVRRVHALRTGSPVTSGGTARRSWGVSQMVDARPQFPAWQGSRGDRTSGGNGPNCGAGSGAGGCVLRGERVHQIAEAAGCIRTAWAGSHMRATQLGVRRFRRLPMRRNPRDRSAGAGSRTWTVSKLWFACLS